MVRRLLRFHLFILHGLVCHDQGASLYTIAQDGMQDLDHSRKIQWPIQILKNP